MIICVQCRLTSVDQLNGSFQKIPFQGISRPKYLDCQGLGIFKDEFEMGGITNGCLGKPVM